MDECCFSYFLVSTPSSTSSVVLLASKITAAPLHYPSLLSLIWSWKRPTRWPSRSCHAAWVYRRQILRTILLLKALERYTTSCLPTVKIRNPSHFLITTLHGHKNTSTHANINAYRTRCACMFAFNSRIQPSYLEPLVQSSEVGRDLRSSTRAQALLDKPRTRTEIGASRFSSAASVVWNAPPASVRESVIIGSFKSQLKTHLCHQHLD